MSALVVKLIPDPLTPLHRARASYQLRGDVANVLPFIPRPKITRVPIRQTIARQDCGVTIVQRWFEHYCKVAAHCLPLPFDQTNFVKEASTCEAVQMIP